MIGIASWGLIGAEAVIVLPIDLAIAIVVNVPSRSKKMVLVITIA